MSDYPDGLIDLLSDAFPDESFTVTDESTGEVVYSSEAVPEQ